VDGSGVNEAMRQKAKLLLIRKEKSGGGGGEYTEERFESDLKELQRAAKKYAGL